LSNLNYYFTYQVLSWPWCGLNTLIIHQSNDYFSLSHLRPSPFLFFLVFVSFAGKESDCSLAIINKVKPLIIDGLSTKLSVTFKIKPPVYQLYATYSIKADKMWFTGLFLFIFSFLFYLSNFFINFHSSLPIYI